MDALFDGLKVVDAGTWIAGPVSSTILADYGADVTKIEMPGDGDAYRRLAHGPGTPNADINYAWAQDARNKRSITINLKTDEGQAILKKLVAQCDVYVTNYPLHMRRRLGLTYDDLKPLNPRMVYASLTAYGEYGPEKDREGFDLVAYWSRSGLMDVVRAPGAKPAHSLPGMGDHPTAISMYASIVTALLHRERTGEGSMVHTSLIANGVWAASCIAAAKFADGSDFSNYPNRAPRYFTREIYETADGRWLQFTFVRTEAETRHFFEVLGGRRTAGRPSLRDPRSPHRVRHGTRRPPAPRAGAQADRGVAGHVRGRGRAGLTSRQRPRPPQGSTASRQRHRHQTRGRHRRRLRHQPPGQRRRHPPHRRQKGSRRSASTPKPCWRNSATTPRPSTLSARTASSSGTRTSSSASRRPARTDCGPGGPRTDTSSEGENSAECGCEPLPHALVTGRVRMQIVRQVVGIRFAEEIQSIHVVEIGIPRSATRINGLGDDFADPRQREAADPVRFEPVDGDELAVLVRHRRPRASLRTGTINGRDGDDRHVGLALPDGVQKPVQRRHEDALAHRVHVHHVDAGLDADDVRLGIANRPCDELVQVALAAEAQVLQRHAGLAGRPQRARSSPDPRPPCSD